MKKKLLTILLAAALTIGAVGCSKGSDNANTDTLQTQENDTDEKKTFVDVYKRQIRAVKLIASKIADAVIEAKQGEQQTAEAETPEEAE